MKEYNRVIELSNQLYKLKKNEKVKFDVYFLIPMPLSEFVNNVNNEIANINPGFIEISDKSICLPHISIAMGYVNSISMLENIFINTKQFVEQTSSFELNASSMYLKGVSPTAAQYLFVDFAQNDFLIEKKIQMEKLLQDSVIENNWDIKKEKAHLTIGCYKNPNDKIYEIIKNYELAPTCKVSQVAISLAGDRGTCLGCLKIFDLK